MLAATSAQIATYETAPGRLALAIEGLSDAQLHYKPSAEEWSIHEIIIHLADAEIAGSWRLRKMLAETHPTLANFDEQSWAKNLCYSTQRRDLALALFTMLRTTNAALLRSLSADAWERTAMHEVRGEISVYDQFTSLVNHVNDHLTQIEHAKQDLPLASV